MKRLFLTIFFASALLLPAFSNAQLGNAGIEDLSIETYPKNPGANTSTTISLSSYSNFVDTANITWYLNNKVQLGGIGKKSFSFTTGATGTTSIVKVIITPPQGLSTTKEIRIVPSGIDLLWQATDSTVPPLYRGKALPASEGKIRFVALPDMKNTSGVRIGQYDLLYSWAQNHEESVVDSGYGKNYFDIDTSYLTPSERIEVNASTRDGVVSATNATSIRTGNPFIAWYPLSPLYGPIFDHAITGEHTISGSSISIVAMPFFFSPGNPSSKTLEYAWTLNGQAINTPSIPNNLFLQRSNSQAGSAVLNVSIASVDHLFQEAVSSIQLKLK